MWIGVQSGACLPGRQPAQTGAHRAPENVQRRVEQSAQDSPATPAVDLGHGSAPSRGGRHRTLRTVVH